MSRVAWVCRSSVLKGEMDQEDTEAAWVFPDGLEVSKQVQYFYGQYGIMGQTETKALAFGEVTEVNGDTVRFSWAAAASQTDDGPWQTSSPPTGQLQMASSDCHEREQGCGRERTSRFGRGRASRNEIAKRCDEYRIHVPEEARAFLPWQAFPVTLMDCIIAEDGELCVRVVTLGGGEMEFQLAEDSVVQALMQLVAEEHQLEANVLVKVVTADETVLEPDSVLRGPIAS